MNLLLFISLLVEFIEGAASTKIASQYTWVWQPYAAPGILYDKIQSPVNGDLKGAKCIDMCLQLLEDGTAWCRYVLLNPYQSEWDKVVPGVHTFVERMSNMIIKECFLFTHQKMSQELSEKYYLSKGFQNKADGHMGTYVILELVTTAYNSLRWPDKLRVPVPEELRYMDRLTQQYFTNTETCPWRSEMVKSQTESTSEAQTTTPLLTTIAHQVVIQYSVLCDLNMRHYFDETTCPNPMDTPQVVSRNVFSAVDLNGCDLIPVSANGRGLIKNVNADSAMAWCASTQRCGMDTPLYELTEEVSPGNFDFVYKTVAHTPEDVFCYVYPSSIISN